MRFSKIFGLLASLILLWDVTANAVEIQGDQGRLAARNYYTAMTTAAFPTKAMNNGIIAEYTVSRTTVNVYRIYNFAGGGWVILSADDRVIPVLAYNLGGNLEPGKGSPDLQWWLEQYAVQIFDCIRENVTPSSEATALWNRLLSGNYTSPAKGSKSVQPLLTSTWDQGNYYNYYCPEDANGPGGRVWSGCVATSMAQVMYYYRYPLHGSGSHGYNSDYGYLEADFASTTYDWNSMQDNINHQFNLPMALLQYHCGIAVDMGYSPDGSGAYMGDATSALKTFFGYSSSATLRNKGSYSETDWNNMLIAELDARHPLSYAGYGESGGHAFVCDGYDGTGKYHFNWGWSGYGDGYYYLNNMNPSGSFSNGQQAIFNLYPATGYPYGCTGTNTITSSYGSFTDGSGPLAGYAANSDCYWLIDPAENVQKIRLSFTRFATEAGNDVVTVYDGATTSDPVLGSFSGSTLPAMLTSSGNKLLVRFSTNGSTEDAGWEASFQSVPVAYCQSMTELTEPSGTFGDGSGPENYNINTACKWRINVAGATGITISFSEFNLEGSDFVSIYDEVSNAALGSFNGTNLPPSVFVYSPRALVFFMTDGLGTAEGFSASYTSSNTGMSENGVPAFMMWPNPASDALYFSVSGIEGLVTLRLLSPTGAEMMKISGLPASGEFQQNMEVSSLPSGLYFLVAEYAGSRVIQKVSVTR